MAGNEDRVAELVVKKLEEKGVVGRCCASHCTAQGCPTPPDHADDHRWVTNQRGAQKKITWAVGLALVTTGVGGVIALFWTGVTASIQNIVGGGPTP